MPEMIDWRRNVVLDHKCDTDECWKAVDHNGTQVIIDMSNGDGLCGISTYVS